MYTGTVKSFDAKKGYGFIVPDGGGEDVFIHFREIKMDGFKNLKKGQRVNYMLTKSNKGDQATEVQIIEELETAEPA
jgi:CspA family cold shock protein